MEASYFKTNFYESYTIGHGVKYGATALAAFQDIASMCRKLRSSRGKELEAKQKK